MQLPDIAAAGVDQNFADLVRRLDVGAIGDVGHDGLGMGAKGALEGFHGFEEQVADGDSDVATPKAAALTSVRGGRRSGRQ